MTTKKTKTVRSKNGRVYTKRTPKKQLDGELTTSPPEDVKIEDVVKEVIEETIEVKVKTIEPKKVEKSVREPTLIVPQHPATPIRQSPTYTAVPGSSKNPIKIYKSEKEIDIHLRQLFGRDYFIVNEQTIRSQGKSTKGFLVKTKDSSCQCYFDITALSLSI